jgi:hypothetical protein
MKRSTKLKCCAICSLVTAVVLLGIGAAFYPIINGLQAYGARSGAILNKANEPNWKDIPGNNNILITRNTFVYNCTNYEDVIYKGVKPTMQEFGPYYYKEYDTYYNVSFGH